MQQLVSILDGNTFLVCDRSGDIEPSFDFPTGIFSFDTRFLSTWLLTLDGERLHALSVDDAHSYQHPVLPRPRRADALPRRQGVDHPEPVRSAAPSPRTSPCSTTPAAEMRFQSRLEMGSDFADLFEIKHQRPKKGQTSAQAGENELRLTYRREAFHRGSDDHQQRRRPRRLRTMTWSITVAPHSASGPPA